MVPESLIYMISEFDYKLMCLLHNKQPVMKKNYTHDLAYYCVKNGCNNVAYEIFENKKFSTAEYENCFEMAVAYNNVNMVEYLYRKIGKNMDYDILHENIVYAIQCKNLDGVRFFLQQTDIDVMFDECSMLFEAVNIRNIECVELILNHPNMFDTCSYNNMALIRSIELNDRDIMDLLFHSDKIDLHEPDNEPLRTAIDMDNKYAVHSLFHDEWVSRTAHQSLDEDYEYHLKRLVMYS